MSSTIDPDDRVEARLGDADVVDERQRAQVVVGDDEDERAEPRALEVADAADDGDDEEVERRPDGDRVGVDLAVPPDVEHAGDAGDEPGEAERQRAVQRHVEAERSPSAPGRRGSLPGVRPNGVRRSARNPT